MDVRGGVCDRWTDPSSGWQSNEQNHGQKLIKWTIIWTNRQKKWANEKTRLSRPSRYAVWIVKRLRYQQTNRPSNGHSQLQRCFGAHLQTDLISETTYKCPRIKCEVGSPSIDPVINQSVIQRFCEWQTACLEAMEDYFISEFSLHFKYHRTVNKKLFFSGPQIPG